MRTGQPVEVGPYSVTYERLMSVPGPNYQEIAARMKVTRDGAYVTTLEPARRNFGARRMATSQAGIATLHFGQLYISISDAAADGSLPARLYWKPLVTLIWLGAVLMAIGRGGLARRPAGAHRRAGPRQGRREARLRMRRLRLALMALIVAAPAFAVQPGEMLKDPALEARARALSGQLRCLVCQNESIDESDADLARDIRLLIRRRIVEGQSNAGDPRFPGFALRRFHPAEAAVQAVDGAACGSARRWLFWPGRSA